MIDAAAKAAPVFRSGNMSLGVALLTELARTTAKMFPDAEMWRLWKPITIKSWTSPAARR